MKNLQSPGTFLKCRKGRTQLFYSRYPEVQGKEADVVDNDIQDIGHSPYDHFGPDYPLEDSHFFRKPDEVEGLVWVSDVLGNILPDFVGIWIVSGT